MYNERIVTWTNDFRERLLRSVLRDVSRPREIISRVLPPVFVSLTPATVAWHVGRIHRKTTARVRRIRVRRKSPRDRKTIRFLRDLHTYTRETIRVHAVESTNGLAGEGGGARGRPRGERVVPRASDLKPINNPDLQPTCLCYSATIDPKRRRACINK